MAQQQDSESEQDTLHRWLVQSTNAAGVPLVVEDEATLLELARRLSER